MSAFPLFKSARDRTSSQKIALLLGKDWGGGPGTFLSQGTLIIRNTLLHRNLMLNEVNCDVDYNCMSRKLWIVSRCRVHDDI